MDLLYLFSQAASVEKWNEKKSNMPLLSSLKCSGEKMSKLSTDFLTLDYNLKWNIDYSEIKLENGI